MRPNFNIKCRPAFYHQALFIIISYDCNIITGYNSSLIWSKSTTTSTTSCFVLKQGNHLLLTWNKCKGITFCVLHTCKSAQAINLYICHNIVSIISR